MRPAFKKIGNKLAFNNPGGEPIFLIVQELEAGYLYFLETTPFGNVNFVHKELVEPEEEKELRSSDSVDGSPKEEVVEETKEKKSTK